MSRTNVASARVMAVLLADGWHRIVRGSFQVAPLSFEAEAGPATPGFRFEEADVGSPYQPTVLIGPLHSIIAVRQAAPALHGLDEQGRADATYLGQWAGRVSRSRAATPG